MNKILDIQIDQLSRMIMGEEADCLPECKALALACMDALPDLLDWLGRNPNLRKYAALLQALNDLRDALECEL